VGVVEIPGATINAWNLERVHSMVINGLHNWIGIDVETKRFPLSRHKNAQTLYIVGNGVEYALIACKFDGLD